MPAPKMTIFLPHSPFVQKLWTGIKSNTITTIFILIRISTLINFTETSKQTPSVNFVFKSLTMYLIHRRKTNLRHFQATSSNFYCYLWIMNPIWRVDTFIWQSFQFPCYDSFSITNQHSESIGNRSKYLIIL